MSNSNSNSNNTVSSQGSQSLNVASQRIIAPSSSVNRKQLQEIRQSVLKQISKNTSLNSETRKQAQKLSIALATQGVQKIQNAQQSELRKMVRKARDSAQKAIPRTAKVVSTTMSWVLKPVRVLDSVISPLPFVGAAYKIGKFVFVLQFAMNVVYRIKEGVFIYAYNSVKGIPYSPPEYSPLMPAWAKTAFSISWKAVSSLYGKMYRGNTPNLTSNVKQFAKNAFAKGVNTVANITRNKIESTKGNFEKMVSNSGNDLSKMISQTVTNFRGKGWAQAGLVAGLEKATTYLIDSKANGSGIFSLPDTSSKTHKNVLSLPAPAGNNWNNGLGLN